MTDIVRVLRILEYVGPREWVEKTISKSIQGEKNCSPFGTDHKTGCIIRAATIGTYPEILSQIKDPEP